MSKCNHNPYWRGHFGTCMICRCERAENALQRIIEHKEARDQQPGLRDASDCIAWEALHPRDPQGLTRKRIGVIP